jgi:hypothetical protein
MIEGNPAAVAAASIDNRLHTHFIEQSGNQVLIATLTAPSPSPASAREA